MSIKRPDFANSDYFVMEDENWHLKEGAPPEVVKEFEEYVQYCKKMEEKGIAI